MQKHDGYRTYFKLSQNELTLILVALEIYIENALNFERDPTIARDNIVAMTPLRDYIRNEIEANA